MITSCAFVPAAYYGCADLGTTAQTIVVKNGACRGGRNCENLGSTTTGLVEVGSNACNTSKCSDNADRCLMATTNLLVPDSWPSGCPYCENDDPCTGGTTCQNNAWVGPECV